MMFREDVQKSDCEAIRKVFGIVITRVRNKYKFNRIVGEEMELNQHICTQLEENARVFTQITLDDDYIVRDNKPDALRIIYTKGEVILEDTRAGNQVVWVTGKLRFSALYQSDDENHRLESVTDEIPFQEKLVMDEAKDGDEVSVNVQIEDLSAGIINSRKLAVRAVLNISVAGREKEDTVITCMMPEINVWRQKGKRYPLMCLKEAKKDILRIQKEMLLPNSKSNIGEIIFYQINFRNEEVLLQDSRIQVQMDAQLWILYRSETTGDYECYETIVPISSSMECERLSGDEIFWAKIRPLETEVEPRGDYDGESRMFGMELLLSADVQIYREEECEVLEDAYSLHSELVFEREQIPWNQLLVKNSSKIRLLEQHQIEPKQEKILQICGSSGNITIDHVEKRENGIQVEGILNVHILYNTTDDHMPFAHAGCQIPFAQFIEIANFSEHAIVWMEGKVEQLQVNLLDNTEYEVKASLQIEILAFVRNTISNIVHVEELPLNIEALQKQPGMIGYIRKEGEDLWDIAKKYHATAENIMEMGDKVLIVKQVHG